jgi:4-amino-4-deoxy-L-arabinose transferase-like glycosyltransferase
LTTDLRQKSLRIILLFVLIGEACRLAQYFSRQSLATAEVQLLMNVQRHPAGQLPFVRLDYFPLSPVAAPPIFLWFTKWIGETFHYGELAVRLIPSALSLIALPLFAIFVWRLLDPVPAAWAVIFFSLSDSLIFQGATSKPYSGDVLIALLILWLAAGENPRRKRPRCWLLLESGFPTQPSSPSPPPRSSGDWICVKNQRNLPPGPPSARFPPSRFSPSSSSRCVSSTPAHSTTNGNP